MPARLEPRDDPQVVIVRESRSLSVLGILVAILLATAAGGAGSWYFLQHMLAQEQQARQETLAAWQHMALQELARQTREQIESAALTSAGERQLIDSSLGRRPSSVRCGRHSVSRQRHKTATPHVWREPTASCGRC